MKTSHEGGSPFDARSCEGGFHEFAWLNADRSANADGRRVADECNCGRIRIVTTADTVEYVDVKPWLNAPAPRRWAQAKRPAMKGDR